MLALEEINAYYGQNHVLKNVSLSVKKGGIVTLIGANGAGKSTTLRTVSGLLKVRSGTIKFGESEIYRMTPDRIAELGIAHVPEGRRVFPKMTVLENLEMGAYLIRKKIGGQGFQANLGRVYDLFPRLRERSKQLAGTLSGGEQQMLAIGRAIMSEPQFILFDEPSLGLAPLMVKMVFETIESIHSQGFGMLIVEQNAVMALNLAEYGYVMELGKIQHHGTSESLKSNDVVVSAYLGKERK
jgi:branched-chain amino acid transport system ATP-binding protein